MILNELLNVVSEPQDVLLRGDIGGEVTGEAYVLAATLREEILAYTVSGIEAEDDTLKVWVEVE